MGVGAGRRGAGFYRVEPALIKMGLGEGSVSGLVERESGGERGGGKQRNS